MQKFKTEYDPYARRTDHYYWDDMNKRMHVRQEYDASKILENNKRQANTNVDHRYGNEMLHHEAEIPVEIVYKWRKEYGVNVFSQDPWHKKKVKQLLNSPDWRYLRTTGRKL